MNGDPLPDGEHPTISWNRSPAQHAISHGQVPTAVGGGLERVRRQHLHLHGGHLAQLPAAQGAARQAERGAEVLVPQHHPPAAR